jgi:hypothetical protein
MNIASSAPPKAKPSSTRGRLVVEDDQHERGAEQAEADGEHADDAAGAEGQPQRRLGAGLVGGVAHAQVGAGRERHADEADQRGEQRAHQEEDRPPDPHRGVVGGQQEQQQEDQAAKTARVRNCRDR